MRKKFGRWKSRVLQWIGINHNKTVFMGLLAVVVLLAVLMQIVERSQQTRPVMKQKKVSVSTLAPTPTVTPVMISTPAPTKNPTEDVYTFLQGPKSWSERRTWSGEWGEAYMDGGSFGGFGCGLCCMANIYSTLSKYRSSPVDMYRYAKKKTFYGGGGAIDWGYMRQTLTSLGMDCKVRKKPSDYQTFQKAVAGSKCCIVLVSSYNSECYWKDTPGHYVTIFLYNTKTDKVFLADSGDPDHNRHWVSLKKIYRSLKTSSNYQYLRVKGYDKSRDSWKHKRAGGNWVTPE